MSSSDTDSSSPAAGTTSQPLQFRVHPAVGVARVGNSEDYVIAPQTMAGGPPSNGQKLTGGLPIRAGTPSDPVSSGDLRDDSGALKRQAARFRIFAYPGGGAETWPRGDAENVVEVTIGSTVGGRTVRDIIWTVHLANKKANTFVLMEDGPYQGILGYEDGRLPLIRNTSVQTRRRRSPPTSSRCSTTRRACGN